MTRTLAKYAKQKLAIKSEDLQRDLQALNEYIRQFSSISNEDLARFNISGHLSVIQGCVSNIARSYQEIQATNYKEEGTNVIGTGTHISSDPVAFYWSSIREEAKRANDLVHELALSISKIRAGLQDCESIGDVPRDIRELNMVLENSLSLLVFDWDA